jgi:kynurenine formamidase
MTERHLFRKAVMTTTDGARRLERREYSLQEVLDRGRRYNNWGQWGDADELGSVNHITPGAVVRAAGLVRTGRVISLALPFDAQGPQFGREGRINPMHTMLYDGSAIDSGEQDYMKELRFTDDCVYMPLQCSTQWDSLAHIFHDGLMYNGRNTSHVTSGGARTNSITVMRDKMFGRGVLLDIPVFLGRDWLDDGEPVGGDTLAECARAQGVDVGPGDFVLIRTGHLARMRAQGSWDGYVGADAPGPGISAADFLCQRRVAATATDTWAYDVRPNESPECYGPLHIIMLRNAGITMGEMFDLEELSHACRDDRRYEFLFTAPPLPITGAVGSPINPLAVK